MPARTLDQSVADQPGLVGRVVVHHQMDVRIGRNTRLDEVEKAVEFGHAVTRIAFADNPAGRDIERSEQAGGAEARRL